MSKSVGQNRTEMQALGLLLQFHGLGQERRKEVHGALLRTYVSMVRALRPEVVLEVGAHEGRFSISAKRVLKDTPVVAFEANPDVWQKHRARLEKEGVTYRNLAVADQPGKIRFKVPIVRGQQALTTGSLLDFTASDEFVEHEVEAVRLDDQGFGTNVLWIDVEGATRQVLAGAERVVASCMAAFIEVEEDERWPGQMVAAEVLDYFEERGFVALLRDAQGDWQYNVILVRRELVFDHRIAPFKRLYFSELRKIANLSPAPATDGTAA